MRLALGITIALLAGGCLGSGSSAHPPHRPSGAVNGTITVGERCGAGGTIGGCAPAFAYRGVLRFCRPGAPCVHVRPGEFGWFSVTLGRGTWSITVGPRGSIFGRSRFVSLPPTSIRIGAGTVRTVPLHAVFDG